MILNYNPYRLGYMPSQWFICFAQLQYNLLVQPYRYTILVVNLNRHLHKDFPRSQASSGSNARSCSTTAEPSKCNARYRKAVYSALWVQLALVVCYIPQFTVRIGISSTKQSSNLLIFLGIANILAYFNSTLNPLLYCWKMSGVRRAVKQTIRQAFCYA